MKKPVEDANEECCCGHARRLHAYSVGMCTRCRRACEKFHRTGEGHGAGPFVVFCLIVAVLAVAAAFGLWHVGAAIVAAILLKF